MAIVSWLYRLCDVTSLYVLGPLVLWPPHHFQLRGTPRSRSVTAVDATCCVLDNYRCAHAVSTPANCVRGIYTASPKRPPFYFLNNSVKNSPILIDFGMSNPRKIWHEPLILSTSPARCNRVSCNWVELVQVSSVQFSSSAVNTALLFGLSNTADAPPPTFSLPRSAALFTAFTLPTVDDIVNAVRQLSDKFSAADPLPTSTLKQVVHLLAPFIVEEFNRSLARGHFPSDRVTAVEIKSAIIGDSLYAIKSKRTTFILPVSDYSTDIGHHFVIR